MTGLQKSKISQEIHKTLNRLHKEVLGLGGDEKMTHEMAAEMDKILSGIATSYYLYANEDLG